MEQNEMIAVFTARGNRDKYTKSALPGTLEITRHYPNVLTSHTIERVSVVLVVGKRDARKVAEQAGAKAWNF